MDFNDAWARPTEELAEQEVKKPSLNPPHNTHTIHPTGRRPFKKVQLLPLTDELSTSFTPQLELLPTLPPVTPIKPPPLIFTDLWGDNNASSSKPDVSPLPTTPTINETIEEQQDQLSPENDLFIVESKNKITLPLELDKIDNKQWQIEDAPFEDTSEEWAEHDITALDMADIFHDLDLFDIDAVLAKQEEDLQPQQAYEPRKDISTKGPRSERWGGVSSLIYVDWADAETAEQEVLERLGYATIALSQATRAFILQAARNARLPHKQEIQLTTQLAHARAQLALIPPHSDEEQIDPYAARRQTLQAEITEIEQTLTCKMQWVAIKKAVHFLGKGIELDDLIQFGMLGVIAGIKHFDITRKARLLLAVNVWTFQSLSRAVSDYGTAIRFPTHINIQIDTLRKHHLQLQIAQGRLPTRQKLAHEIKMSVEQLLPLLHIEALFRDSKQMISLERMVQDEVNNDGYSFQAVENNCVLTEDTAIPIIDEARAYQMLNDLFHYLSPRQQLVLSMRIGLGQDEEAHTLEEIGTLLKVTRERVRQIEDKAKQKIQSYLKQMYPELNILQESEKNAVNVTITESASQQTENSKSTASSQASRQPTKEYLKARQQYKEKVKGQKRELKEIERIFSTNDGCKPQWLQ